MHEQSYTEQSYTEQSYGPKHEAFRRAHNALTIAAQRLPDEVMVAHSANWLDCDKAAKGYASAAATEHQAAVALIESGE